MEELPEEHKIHLANSSPMEAELTSFWASFLDSRSPFHPQLALKLFYQTENFGFPLEGGIDDELAVGLIRLARDSKQIAPGNRLSQCFVEEACRAHKAGERARILKCLFWFLRSRPSKEDYVLVGRLLSRLTIGDRAILSVKRVIGGTVSPSS